MEGKTLKRMRRRAQLTQGELAERLGVTLTSVSRWETGIRRISPQIARHIILLLRGTRTGDGQP